MKVLFWNGYCLPCVNQNNKIMKVYFYLCATLLFAGASAAQTVKPANVYPTNLEENMYYEKFDPATNIVSGIHFLVLSDGDNSQHVTPAFEVSIYLLPEGSTSANDVIIVKTYKLDGLYHMGSREFKGEKVDLNTVSGLRPGNYRMGVWVNSSRSFQEDTNDNAALFRGTITFKGATTSNVKPTEKKEEKKSTEWEEEDEDEDW
jgi:hypothetical protein